MQAKPKCRRRILVTNAQQSIKMHEAVPAALVADNAASLALQSPTRLVSPSPDPLTSLPPDVLTIIIHLAGKRTWLALFRTCKQLRDVVVSQAAAGWSTRLRIRLTRAGDVIPLWDNTCLGSTCFYGMEDWNDMLGSNGDSINMAADWDAGYAPAGLESQDESTCFNMQTWHDIMGSNGESINVVADLVASCALARLKPQSENTGSSNSPSPMHLHMAAAAKEGTQAQQKDTPAPAQSMISFLFSQWPTAPLPGTALQHITYIRLEGVLLDHALPDCIGRSCPALREYQLHSVKWRRALWSVRPWPQLQRLTLDNSGNIKPRHGTLRQYLQFNTDTLPRLSSLCVRRGWRESGGSNELHHAYAGCCATFSSQLTSLTMNVLTSHGSKNAANIFLSRPSLALPQLTTLHVENAVITGSNFTALLKAAPMLTHFKVHGMALLSSCAGTACGLKSFVVSSEFTPFVPGIARLPRMPHLVTFDLPNCDFYDTLKAQPQDVAAAAKALSELPCMRSGFILYMSSWSSWCEPKRPHVRPFSVAHLKPLLDVVQKHTACIILHFEHVTESLLTALGATGVPRIQFEGCTMVPATLCERIWSLMPEVSEVGYTSYAVRGGSTSPLDDVLCICHSATRPVTVVPSYALKDEIRQTLQAEGNTLVTVK